MAKEKKEKTSSGGGGNSGSSTKKTETKPTAVATKPVEKKQEKPTVVNTTTQKKTEQPKNVYVKAPTNSTEAMQMGRGTYSTSTVKPTVIPKQQEKKLEVKNVVVNQTKDNKKTELKNNTLVNKNAKNDLKNANGNGTFNSMIPKDVPVAGKGNISLGKPKDNGGTNKVYNPSNYAKGNSEGPTGNSYVNPKVVGTYKAPALDTTKYPSKEQALIAQAKQGQVYGKAQDIKQLSVKDQDIINGKLTGEREIKSQDVKFSIKTSFPEIIQAKLDLNTKFKDGTENITSLSTPTFSKALKIWEKTGKSTETLKKVKDNIVIDAVKDTPYSISEDKAKISLPKIMKTIGLGYSSEKTRDGEKESYEFSAGDVVSTSFGNEINSNTKEERRSVKTSYGFGVFSIEEKSKWDKNHKNDLFFNKNK